jgi:hypothetical protein
MKLEKGEEEALRVSPTCVSAQRPTTTHHHNRLIAEIAPINHRGRKEAPVVDGKRCRPALNKLTIDSHQTLTYNNECSEKGKKRKKDIRTHTEREREQACANMLVSLAFYLSQKIPLSPYMLVYCCFGCYFLFLSFKK